MGHTKIPRRDCDNGGLVNQIPFKPKQAKKSRPTRRLFLCRYKESKLFLLKSKKIVDGGKIP